MKIALGIACASLAAATAAFGQTVVIDYEDLPEDHYGTEFTHKGVTYHSINEVSGVFPDGSTFEPEDAPDVVVIENATLLYNDFAGWGSATQALQFGIAFITGDNLTLGRIASVTMDLEAPADAASFEMAYYENGPWGGIVYHLDALMDGEVVASDSFVISDLGGRDNIAFEDLAVDGATFDQLHFYATYGDEYSLPRVLMDDLTISWVEDEPCPADMDGDGTATVDDLLAYLGGFRAGDGDMDGDGATDVGDLLAYLGAFRAGC